MGIICSLCIGVQPTFDLSMGGLSRFLDNLCCRCATLMFMRRVASKSNIFSYFHCTICTCHLMYIGVVSSVFCSALCKGVLPNNQFWWWVMKHGAGRDRKISGLPRETSLSMFFVCLFVFTAISIIQYFIFLGTVTTDLIYSRECLRYLQIVIHDLEIQRWETCY